MIAGFVCMLVANAAVLLASHAALRRVRTGRNSLDLTLFLIFRFLILSALVVGAGLARVLTPWGVGAIGALLLAGLVGMGEHRALPPFRWPRLGILPGIFLGALLVRLLLQVWFFAPYAGDALSYHLPKIAEWVRAGGFTLEHGADTRSTFPAGFELVETWWVVFLRHDVLIELAGVEFFLLMLAAAHALAGTLGLSGRAAMLASLGAACTPGMLLQATSCLNDGPIAALLIATAALIAARANPLLIALPVALGLGVKPVFGYALPGLILLAWLRRREPASPIGAPRLALAFAVLAAAIGGFWYARNALLYGNPVHPVTAAGFVSPDGVRLQRVGPDVANLRENVRRAIDSRIYDHIAPWSAWLFSTAGWGPLVFAAGLPGLVFALKTEARWRGPAAGFLVSLLSVFLLVQSDPWFMRFVLFFPTLLAMAAARLAAEFRPLRIIFGVCLLLQFVGTMVPGEFPVGELGSLVRQGWRERRFERAAERAREEVVGCLAPGGRKSYALYGPAFDTRVVTLRPADADELIAALRREGIRVLNASYRSEPLRECLERRLLCPSVGAFYELK